MTRAVSILLSLAVGVFPLPAQTVAPAPPAATQPAAPAPLADRVALRLQEILATFQQRAGFPGGGIGFVLPDGSCGAVAVGLADVEQAIPMRVDHRLPAGSIGKTFVAAVALQLVEKFQLELDQPIAKWLGEREWFKRLPNADAITVRMLMNHTSGIPEHVLMPEFRAALHDQPDKVWKPEELVAFVLDKPAKFRAGEPGHWSYADTNYVLLGMIIEQITGEQVYDLVSARMLRPLKLSDTLPQDRRDLPGLACGYMQPGRSLIETESPRTLIDGRFFINPQFEWCGGGLVSTPLDLARWVHALRGGASVLGKDARKIMLESVPAQTGRDHRYGLGLQIRPSDHGLTRGHGGYFPGAMSEMLYFPDHHISLAIMVNSDHHTSPHTLVQCLDQCAAAIVEAIK